MSYKMSRSESQPNRVRLLVALLSMGMSIPALAQSVPFPTYTPGPQTNGTFILGDGRVITPAGTQVNLGIRVRAKAVALNPEVRTHTAAVLTMGTSSSNGNGAVEVFNTQTGAVLQNYNFGGKDSSGSITGLTYTRDGKYLLFSQESSYVAIAKVDPSTGMLSDYAHVQVSLDANYVNIPGAGTLPVLNTANCTQTVTMPVTNVPMSAPVGSTGSVAIPCGIPVSSAGNGSLSAGPMGLAVSPDDKTAYAVLDFNNELTKIDLTQATLKQGVTVRVGNVPHSVVVSLDGRRAYVSNEAGRIAKTKDFQLYSNGTPVAAANPVGNTATGTVSVVDLESFKVIENITTGLHPTGMAFWGTGALLVANTYDDSISMIDTVTNKVVRTIKLGMPNGVGIGGESAAYGLGPNSITVDNNKGVAYVALYNANAIAVVDLNSAARFHPFIGMIPTAYAPSSVALDTSSNVLIVANDKGWGTTGNPNPFEGTVSGAPLTDNSTGKYYGVKALNTHQDLGTVSIVPVPTSSELALQTTQVFQNNHWDLKENVTSTWNADPTAKPKAVPKHIGEPSLIKHVFLIIRENRTYDQILGDVAAGNGDANLAVFGDNATFGSVTPNAHALVQRFPLFDNFYDPSRQSADGHNWIVQAMAPYSDDIQSPDWLRDYPSNGGDALAYSKTGSIYNLAAKAGITFKNYGEYIEENTFNPPGCTPTINTGSCEPSWTDFYNDTLAYESGQEPQLKYYSTIGSYSPLPDVMNHTIQPYPQFDLGIPDQYRVDVWQQDFAKDVKNGTVPQLSILWISSDHTGGPPTAQAMQADNDLALGRFVDIISHSSVWKDSAIFVEQDDSQNGVDHVDGHRSPGYIISPYVKQGGVTDSTFYTQVNMTRTIEQILGLHPINRNDLVASPMTTAFVDNPPADNFQPWTHVVNGIPLDEGVTATVAKASESAAVKALRTAWLKKKAQIFAGRYHKPDSEDPDIVNHLDWYEATGFIKPYPGEKKVRPASDFKRKASASADLDD